MSSTNYRRRPSTPLLEVCLLLSCLVILPQAFKVADDSESNFQKYVTTAFQPSFNYKESLTGPLVTCWHQCSRCYLSRPTTYPLNICGQLCHNRQFRVARGDATCQLLNREVVKVRRRSISTGGYHRTNPRSGQHYTQRVIEHCKGLCTILCERGSGSDRALMCQADCDKGNLAALNICATTFP